MSKKLALMDCDGAVDDYLSVVLLMTMEEVETLGVIVTPADCYIQPAVSATPKIMDLMGRSEVPAASTVRGLNPFPVLFPRDSFACDRLPILNEKGTIDTPLISEPGQNFMVRVLRDAAVPVTLMITGPLTTVAQALDIAPETESKIQEIVWKGGALNVMVNVMKDMEPGQDMSAEWKGYWDPIAIERIWQTQIPIVMCPLDITNNVPLTVEFSNLLEKQRKYPISHLAGQCYALAISQDYYFGDIFATAY
jgi:purine nucleosidase